MSLLEIRNVTKRYPVTSGVFRRVTGHVTALENVSLSVEAGETLALAGGSGCGKTTLARVIVGLIAPEAGEMLWDGQPWLAKRAGERARLAQMIFQDPYASLNPKLSVGSQLAEMVRMEEGKGASAKAVRERCAEVLASVRMPPDTLSHYPFQFSGGQRQRIAIARALALKPKLLIADEPLSALDVSIQAEMLKLFAELKAQLGLTILLITHDLAVAAEAAARIVILEAGRVVEEGQIQPVFCHPQHPYTRSLIEAVPTLDR